MRSDGAKTELLLLLLLVSTPVPPTAAQSLRQNGPGLPGPRRSPGRPRRSGAARRAAVSPQPYTDHRWRGVRYVALCQGGRTRDAYRHKRTRAYTRVRIHTTRDTESPLLSTYPLAVQTRGGKTTDFFSPLPPSKRDGHTWATWATWARMKRESTDDGFDVHDISLFLHFLYSSRERNRLCYLRILCDGSRVDPPASGKSPPLSSSFVPFRIMKS